MRTTEGGELTSPERRRQLALSHLDKLLIIPDENDPDDRDLLGQPLPSGNSPYRPKSDFSRNRSPHASFSSYELDKSLEPLTTEQLKHAFRQYRELRRQAAELSDRISQDNVNPADLHAAEVLAQGLSDLEAILYQQAVRLIEYFFQKYMEKGYFSQRDRDLFFEEAKLPMLVAIRRHDPDLGSFSRWVSQSAMKAAMGAARRPRPRCKPR